LTGTLGAGVAVVAGAGAIDDNVAVLCDESVLLGAAGSCPMLRSAASKAGHKRRIWKAGRVDRDPWHQTSAVPARISVLYWREGSSTCKHAYKHTRK
jgi:hypothetical protein